MFGMASPALVTPRGYSVQYFAIAHDTLPRLSIYKRTGDILVKLDDPASLPAGNASGCSFSPDGKFLAVAHTTTPFVTIYSRAGDVFTKLTNPASLPTGDGKGIAWSANGSFMVVFHDLSPWITIYSVSAGVFTKVADPAILPTATANGGGFSPDGSMLAVAQTPDGGGSQFTLRLYGISGTTFTKLADPTVMPVVTQPAFACAFSPNGAYLAVASGSQAQSHTIYSISGTTFTKITNPSMPTAAFDASWSDDSNVLVLGFPYDRAGATFTNRVRAGGVGITTRLGDKVSPSGRYIGVAGFPTSFMAFYKKTGSTVFLLANPGTIPTGTGRGCSWSPEVEQS